MMTVEQCLQQFYKANNLPFDGGETNPFFELNFRFFKLKLPNPKFRKKVIHIHDIQHIIYNCDVSWKGESFVAGLEIATGFWKKFPIGVFSLWAMGVAVLLYPRELFKGYKKGWNSIGIADLKLSKKELLRLQVSELKAFLTKEKTKKVNAFAFFCWSLIGVFVFLFPIFVLIGLVIWIF